MTAIGFFAASDAQLVAALALAMLAAPGPRVPRLRATGSAAGEPGES